MQGSLLSAGGGGGPGGGPGGKGRKTPPGIFVYYVLAIALGSDYTINLSSAPSYFSRMAVFNDTLGLNNSALHCTDAAFYANSTSSAGDTNYSYSLTLWSVGQFLGCIASIFMPPKIGNRLSFMIFVGLSAVGNIMYLLADPSVVGSSGTALALSGKFLNGFGDGSIALGMSYLPLYAPLEKKAEALVNYRTFVSLGTAVGCAVSIAISSVFVDSGLFCLNPGNISVTVTTVLFVLVWFGSFAINTKRPPSKGMNSFDRSFGALFWIFLNFFRGFCTQIGNAYIPTYAYETAGFSPFVQGAFSSIVLFLCYLSSMICSFLVTAAGCVRWNQFCCNKPCEKAAAVLGRHRRVGNGGGRGSGDDDYDDGPGGKYSDRVDVETLDYQSVMGSDDEAGEYADSASAPQHSPTRAKKPLSFYFKRRNIARSTLLNSVRTSSFLVIIALLMMWFGSSHRALVDSPSPNEKSGDQVVFIIGGVLFFGFTTMISAAAVPIFKNVLPRSSLSTMMPLFKVSLDMGKVVGPLWATMATTINRKDVAPYVSVEGWLVGYLPPTLIFLAIFVILITIGRKLSTPAGGGGSGGGGGAGGGGGGASSRGDDAVGHREKDISMKATNRSKVKLGYQNSQFSVSRATTDGRDAADESDDGATSTAGRSHYDDL